MKKIIILLLLMSFLTESFAQNNAIEFTEYDLPNGLHVILHQDNSLPIVAVSVLYKVGSKNEDPERTGFAHFFEHLMFEGSENIKRGEFDKYLENAGATNNANTNNDRTFYYEILPSNQLELALWMESERMLHAKIDAKGIETQREVVKEERREGVDNQPYGTVLEETMKRVYKKHPYRWPVIGSMDHLNSATKEDFINFYKTFYVPNNATLSIAGDINIKQSKKWIAKYFKDIPKGAPIPEVRIKEDEQKEELRDIVYDNIQLPAVIHAFKTPGIGSKDFYEVKLLMQLLSQGESSRLNKSIKDQQQKALAVGAFPFDLEDDPSVSIAFAIANVGIEAKDLESSLDAEYEKVKNELISEEELQKLKNQVESDFYSANSSLAGIAENLANYEVYYGDANLVNTEIKNYLKVSREDIQRVAKKYLNKTNRVSLFYLPKSQKPE